MTACLTARMPTLTPVIAPENTPAAASSSSHNLPQNIAESAAAYAAYVEKKDDELSDRLSGLILNPVMQVEELKKERQTEEAIYLLEKIPAEWSQVTSIKGVHKHYAAYVKLCDIAKKTTMTFTDFVQKCNLNATLDSIYSETQKPMSFQKASALWDKYHTYHQFAYPNTPALKDVMGPLKKTTLISEIGESGGNKYVTSDPDIKITEDRELEREMEGQFWDDQIANNDLLKNAIDQYHTILDLQHKNK